MTGPDQERSVCVEVAVAVGRSVGDSLFVEHRQPHGRLIRRCPFDPVFSVRRDVDVIARLHVDRLVVALEEQFGFALQGDNTFGFFLIVPKPIGTGVAGGHDPFDADVLVLSEDIDEFLGEIAG